MKNLALSLAAVLLSTAASAQTSPSPDSTTLRPPAAEGRAAPARPTMQKDISTSMQRRDGAIAAETRQSGTVRSDTSIRGGIGIRGGIREHDSGTTVTTVHRRRSVVEDEPSRVTSTVVRTRAPARHVVVVHGKKPKKHVVVHSRRYVEEPTVIERRRTVRRYEVDEPGVTVHRRVTRSPGVSVGVGVSTTERHRFDAGPREGAAATIRSRTSTSSPSVTGTISTRSSTQGGMSSTTRAPAGEGRSGAPGGLPQKPKAAPESE